MYVIEASGFIETYNFLEEHNLSSYKMVNFSIGNDDKIYCLFAEKVPELINGMFVPTTNNSRYKAVSFTVDWYSGEVYSSELIDFGLLKINVHSLQPIGENFLLLGSRAMLYKDGITDKNALIISRFGNKINEFCLGDGIENCLVDSQNNIITSYFDEGNLLNNECDKPGIIKWAYCSEQNPQERGFCVAYARD